MIKYNYTRLMYPEPENTGGGAEPTPETPDTGVNADDNVFDFDTLTDSNETENEQTEDTETDDDYALSLPDDLGLDKEEINIFTSAAKKYGIDKEAASGMVSEFTKAINENVQRVQAAEMAEAEKALRSDWGENFNSNVKRAGELIKKVGQAAGWSPELMNSFKNANSFRVFYDIARVMGSGRTVGLANNTPAQAKTMSKGDIEGELMNTVSAFWNAKSQNNKDEAQRLSDRHKELQKMLTGKNGARLLLP